MQRQIRAFDLDPPRSGRRPPAQIRFSTLPVAGAGNASSQLANKFFAVFGYNAGELHEHAITYRFDKGLTLVMKNSGANIGRGPMPSVPSPARPNTPPASQRHASGKVFSPTENAQAFVPSTLVPSAPSVPAKAAKPVPFAIPRPCALCRTYHEGGCTVSPPEAASSSSKPGSAQHIYETYQATYQPQDRRQPFEIMHAVTQGQLNFTSPQASQAVLEKVAHMKFTLRHYTSSADGPPAFNTISSNFELVHRHIKTLQRTQGSNTNQDDWVRLGNTAFTFFLLAVDGKVAQRKFLAAATHYAEIDPDDLEQMAAAGLSDAELFASPDLLHTKDLSTAKAIRGPLKDLKALMVASSGLKPIMLGRTAAERLLTAIDEPFGGTLEIKVPGAVNVTQWHRV
ncbi:hypothetical protein FGA82_21935 [Pseudomonas fluorescens]|uniref:hypothetical protein n=1 Tax=Pseudomonas fluorescens TaxID=294 RepID=UPI001131C142|nr:hypothetical protein [Pseudomonas fluorescens]TMU73935.1 hypothetical protein FGA82_21935 [Pseudomonas fluorescens]